MASRNKIENKLNENDKLITYCLENINDAFNLDFGLSELIANFQYIKNVCVDEPIIRQKRQRNTKLEKLLFEQIDERIKIAEQRRLRENSFERLYM